MDYRDYLPVMNTLKRHSEQSVTLSYDAEGGVLYINFKPGSAATDSEIDDEDVIVRYLEDEVIGYTVLHASQR
jgi:uncharacterized protein YuzE